MGWFSACIFYKGTHITHPTIEPLWEQSIVLIQADSEDQAREKAMLIGDKEQVEYEVNDGPSNDPTGRLRWTREEIGIHQIDRDDLKDGTEIFSAFLREEGVKSILEVFEEDKKSKN